jgi:hypothetical protein
MKKTTKEYITPKFIESLESDLELLKSREPELTRLVDNLRTVEGKIKTLTAKISANAETKPLPHSGGVLSLEGSPPWGNFIDELKKQAHNNEERTKFENELDVLTAEQKEITARIIEIVPSSIRKYRPKIKAKQFTIDVSDDRVGLIG